jgi:dynein light intermediate chain, axonemal
VRDEIRMTIDAYKTLYDSSVTFGTRKQLQAEQGIPEMEQRIEASKQKNYVDSGMMSWWLSLIVILISSQELSERKRTLEAQVLALRNKIDMVERRQAERRGLDEKRRQEEIAYLKHQAKHLDLFLKSMPKS